MKKPRSFFKIDLFITLGLIGYFMYIIFVYQQGILDVKNSKLQDVKLKIEEEKNIKEQLKKQEQEINSDEFIEKMAREKLSMLKQGEREFVDMNK